MKLTQYLSAALIILLLVMIAGCDYEGPTAQWTLVEEETDSPTITSVDPSVAVPGINYLTIQGENFTDNQDNVSVYVNGYKAEIVDFSDSSIKIRRPDRSGDSLSIKVDVYGAVNLGRWEPYIIQPVREPYGEFLSGTALGCLAVDEDETVYVVENTTTHEAYKVPQGGERTLLGQIPTSVNGMAIGPDGKMYCFGNKKEIYRVDADSVRIYATVAKNVTQGVFDSYGNLYVSGRRVDLFVIAPDLSIKTAGLYASDEVFSFSVIDNNLYALVEFRSPTATESPFAIMRHPILDDQGTLGAGEVVFDWASAGEVFAESDPLTFAFDSKGALYIGSDNASSVLYVDISTGQTEEIYKGILPSAASKLAWGHGNYLYMVHSSTSDNNLYRLDMGRPEDRDF